MTNDAAWEILFELLKNRETNFEGENHWPELLLAIRGMEVYSRQRAFLF